MSDLATYQEAVRRLTAENAKLRADCAAAESAHRSQIRQLEAQIGEGLSPELLTLRQEIRRWRARALAAEGRLSSYLRSAG